MGADTLAVDMLAAARLTRLLTTDTFPPVRLARETILNKVDPHNLRQGAGEPPALAELIECNWCAGFWISCGVIAARRFVPAVWDPISRALATSMVVGLVAGVSEREGDLSDLGKTLDGVGLFVGSAIRGAGGAIGEAIRSQLEVPAPDQELSEDDWRERNRAIDHG